MSASEKLKVLEARTATTHVALASATLVNALPQIVAVVAAAEELRELAEGFRGRGIYLEGEELLDRASSALADLETGLQ